MFRRYKKLLQDKNNNNGYRFEELGEGEEEGEEGEGEEGGMTEAEVETLLSAVDVSFIPSFILLFQVFSLPLPFFFKLFSSPPFFLDEIGCPPISTAKHQPA